MFRTIGKKPLFLLFVVAAITMPRLLSPMKQCWKGTVVSSGPEQPSTKTTIEALPQDCLFEIFRFCPDEGKKKSANKVAELRSVCRKFKFVVDNYDCYFTRIKDRPYFLPYQLKHKPLFPFRIFLHDKKSVKALANAPFISDVKEERFWVSMKLPEEGLVTFLKPYLKQLMSRLNLEFLEIQYNGTPGRIKAYNCKSSGPKNLIFQKKTIQDGELSMFGEAEQLEIRNGYNLISNPTAKPSIFGKVKNLLNVFNICDGHTLADQTVKKSTTECLLMRKSNLKFLKSFPYLRTLEINNLSSFKGTLLNSLAACLEKFSITYCKKFDTTGLGKLKKLYQLEIDDFGEFISTSPKQLKNTKKLVLYGSPTPFKKIFGKEAEKKVSKILKTVGEQTKLKNLTIYGNYASLEKPGIIKALEKLELNGCIIEMPKPYKQTPIYFD